MDPMQATTGNHSPFQQVKELCRSKVNPKSRQVEQGLKQDSDPVHPIFPDRESLKWGNP